MYGLELNLTSRHWECRVHEVSQRKVKCNVFYMRNHLRENYFIFAMFISKLCLVLIDILYVVIWISQVLSQIYAKKDIVFI